MMDEITLREKSSVILLHECSWLGNQEMPNAIK